MFLVIYVDDMVLANKSKEEIENLKQVLKSKFDLKDLGNAKKTFEMEIIRDRVKNILTLSQQSYLEKVLKRFSMENTKAVGVPLAWHFKMSSGQCPKIDKEKEKMVNVPMQVSLGPSCML